jgi:hypothetical protein
MARIKPIVLEPLRAVTTKLTPTAGTFLQRLSQDVADRTGWPVRSSTVVRALIEYARRQSPEWAATALLPLVEEEIAAGRVWGKFSAKGKKRTVS